MIDFSQRTEQYIQEVSLIKELFSVVKVMEVTSSVT